MRIGQKIGFINGRNARVVKKYARCTVVATKCGTWTHELRNDDERLTRAPYSRRSKVWLSVYEVTRHYGGPEEGGWWYNWYTPIAAVYVPRRFLLEHRDRLERKYKERDRGNIYSVLGGVEYSVSSYGGKFGLATTEQPHYE